MDFTQIKTIVGICSATLCASLAQILGGWDIWLQTLILFQVLDYVSGTMVGGIKGQLNSQVGFKGILKKVFILFLVAVGYKLDLLMGTNIIRYAVCGFYIGVEGLSLLENSAKIGLPLPDVLKNTLIQFKNGEKHDS